MHEGWGDIFDSAKADAKKGLHYYSVHVVEEPDTSDGMFYTSAGYFFHMFVCKTAPKHVFAVGEHLKKYLEDDWEYQSDLCAVVSRTAEFD